VSDETPGSEPTMHAEELSRFAREVSAHIIMRLAGPARDQAVQIVYSVAKTIVETTGPLLVEATPIEVLAVMERVIQEAAEVTRTQIARTRAQVEADERAEKIAATPNVLAPPLKLVN
jgi:hypothetical protein